MDAFAAAGARVVAHARQDQEAAAVADEAESATGGFVRPWGADLTDPAAPAGLVDAATEHLGGLDILILNAGVLGEMGPMIDTPVAQLRDVLEVNVIAQHALVQTAAPMLLDSSASVLIWLSSTLGKIGLPGYGAYAASKHAVEGLMKVLASETEDAGLVTVALAPGMVQTEMLQAALGTDDVSEFQTAENTAAAVVRMVRSLTSSDHGASFDIDPWL